MTLSQSAFGALLSTTDKQHVRAGVAITSVLVSAAMAILLVPRFGLNGAVIAHAVSSSVIYIAICVGMVKAFSVTLPLRELSRLFLAAAVAAVPSGALLWLGSSVFLQFFAGVAFVVFYLVGTLVFRAWRPDDIARLNPLARRYPRTLGRVLPALERWVSR
jgi:O-antigen/teichoic acid export membrane protein